MITQYVLSPEVQQFLSGVQSKALANVVFHIHFSGDAPALPSNPSTIRKSMMMDKQSMSDEATPTLEYQCYIENMDGTRPHVISTTGYDSWRPNPKPDANNQILTCRTPVGEHDTGTGLTHITLWIIPADASDETLVVDTPTAKGWVSYSHPEWSPSGDDLVLAVETSTQYQLVVLDTAGSPPW